MPKANNGKRFEENFKKSVINHGLFFERMIDSNKFGFGDNTRFTSKSPYDCLFFDGYHLYLVELKSTVGTSISFNNPILAKPSKDNKMIKYHQVKSLMDRSKFKNVCAMFILDYADRINSKGEVVEGGTFAIPIENFVDWANSVDKGSINIHDARQIGYEVTRFKKKVNYSYDIEDLTDELSYRYFKEGIQDD